MVVSKDRTNELHQVFEEVRRMQGVSKPSPSVTAPRQLSQFHLAAQEVTKELTGTAEMLENLSKLTQQRNIFEDHTAEVNQVTVMIKDRLANLHTQMSALNQIKEQNRQWRATQANTHSNTVVSSLRSQLVNTQKSFREVLQKRTKKMKTVNDRRAEFTSSLSTAGQSSSLFRQADEEEEGLLMGGSQVMATRMNNSNLQYFRSRQEGVKAIEKILGELQELFSDFSKIVAEQEEMVQRIDANTEDALESVVQGQNQLLKHLNSISSNRSLLLKIFGILFVFVIVFGLFVVK